MSHGLNSAAAVITGNTIGEGKYEQAKKQSVTVFIISVVIGIFSCLLALLLKNPLIACYKITQETYFIAQEMLTALAFVNFFHSIANINMFGTLRGGGDSKFVAVVDVCSMWFLSVPLGRISGLVLNLPVGIVYVCLKASTIFESVASIFRILSGKWVKDVTKS